MWCCASTLTQTRADRRVKPRHRRSEAIETTQPSIRPGRRRMTPWEGIPIALVGLGPEMVVGGGDEFQPASNADQHELKGEWECIGGAMDVRRDWRRPQRIECVSDGYRPSKPLQPESSPRHIVFSHGKQSMAHIYRGVERLPASGPMVGSLAQPPQRQAVQHSQPASQPRNAAAMCSAQRQ